MLRRFLFCVLLAAASASAGACGSDPPLDVAQNVDLGQFQGKWYEIAKLPRFTQTDCHGTTAFYSRGADGRLALVNQCNVGGPTGPLKTVAMTATVPDTTVQAKLSLDVGGYVGDYWILEVGSHYEYAVVGHPSRSYFWILSRTPTLGAETVGGILDRAKANQFDTSNLEYTPQPPGSERSASDAPEGPVPPPADHGCSVMAARGAEGDAAPFGLGLGVALVALSSARRSSAPRPARRS